MEAEEEEVTVWELILFDTESVIIIISRIFSSKYGSFFVCFYFFFCHLYLNSIYQDYVNQQLCHQINI